MRSRFTLLWIAALVTVAALILSPTTTTVVRAATSGVVISAMYPGGGNPGATYTHDYIEIFNSSDIPVDITNWSVQYSNPVSAHWQKTFMPPVVLLPGQYLLARQDPGPHGTAKPPADAKGSVGMQGDGSFKVTIVRSRLTIHGHSPWEDLSMTDRIEDFFGGGVANRWEGEAKVGTLDWTQAWYRLDSGCQDTDNNNADFYSGPAYPYVRSMKSPLAPCSSTELVANGDFEEGISFWTLTGSSNVKCNSKGLGSDCALKMKASSKVEQTGQMAGILSGTPNAAGDMVQVSAFTKSKLTTKVAIAVVKLIYADPTAGARNNGEDKVKLKVKSASGYKAFSQRITLGDSIVDGSVKLKFKRDGKIFVDNFSVILIPMGVGVPRAVPPSSSVLPLPPPVN